MMHRLLLRQLKRLSLSEDTLPETRTEWREFLGKIDLAYRESDQDRYLLERSLQISSREMHDRWNAMRAIEESWRSLGECVPDLIVLVDKDGRISFTNHPARGFAKDELVGWPIESLFGLERQKVVLDAIHLVLQTGRKRRLEFEIVEAEGRKAWSSLRMSPICKGNEITGVVIVETDISDSRSMSEALELERAKALHASKMAALGEMAGGIAHEINSPLAAILMAAALIKEDLEGRSEPAVEAIESVEIINETVTRISKIIKGLKAFARQSDQETIATCLVKSIIEDALDLCRTKMDVSHITLRVGNYSKDLAIDCCDVQIVQVILNLCNNACDAVEGLKERWIEIDVKETDRGVLISCSDSGPGVPPALREKIMNPFFTTKPPGKGTGLGLSISKGIIERHGGAFYLDESSPFTKFVVELPKRPGLSVEDGSASVPSAAANGAQHVHE